jgi:hypothetical protein
MCTAGQVGPQSSWSHVPSHLHTRMQMGAQAEARWDFQNKLEIQIFM